MGNSIWLQLTILAGADFCSWCFVEYLVHSFLSRRWDRVFGSLPETRKQDYAAVVDTPLLTGPSNFRDSWNPRLVWKQFWEARLLTLTRPNH